MIMKNKMISFQNDVFSKNAENHRLKARIKDLEAKNTLNAKNRNNTSSAFTLPSEFKTCWEELVKVLILDAFPDFMDKYKLLVPLAQEILILLIQAIKTQRDEKLSCIGDLLNIHGDEDGMNHLDVKTKALFQEYSLKIFQFDDEFYQNLVFNQYMPICKEIIDGYEDDDDEDYLELLDEAVNSDDFKNFVKSLHKIVLHISLSDPPISLDLVSHSERVKKTEIFDMYEFKKFKKTEMFCIDGFPKEDLPSVIVYPPPMKGKYVYQGIKPSVITLPEAEEDIVEYVKSLKEAEKPSKKKSGKQEERKETERKQENSEVLKEKDNPKVGVVEEKQLDSKPKKEKLDKNEVDDDSCFKCDNDPSISKQSKEPSICNSKRA